MRIHKGVVFLVFTVLIGCSSFQNLNTSPVAPDIKFAAKAIGETVADIGNSCWIVFQDKNNNHWFGSDGNGVFRYDGKVITRFTTKDGLAHDQIRGIHQHAATGHILITTNGGVSKFDGDRFVTLPIIEMKSSDEGWALDVDDKWMPGAGGPRRYDGTTLYQLKLPKSPMADEWYAKHPSVPTKPSDVWTVYRDRKGHMWFGTACFGICRYDGKVRTWLYEDHLTYAPNGGLFGIRSIIEDRHGDFWFCNTKFRFAIQPAAASAEDSDLISYQRKAGIDLKGSATTDDVIYYQSITEDNHRDLWMAPYGGGVWKYDGKKVSHYPMQIGDEEILMISIYKDNRGDIWVATQDHGAWKFNGTRFEQFQP